MPITVQCEDENGEHLGQIWSDPSSTRALANPLEDSSCLQYIDPFGDTVFNHLQVPQLLHELRGHSMSRRDAQLSKVIDALIYFLEHAPPGPHIYARFVGD